MKKKWEFENGKVLTVFNCLNHADREKDKSNYRFPSIAKNIGKEDLKLSNSVTGKMISLNFQERFNWEKARKNKNENNAFCVPFIIFFFFSHKFHNIRFESKYVFYTNSNQTWTASVGVLN